MSEQTTDVVTLSDPLFALDMWAVQVEWPDASGMNLPRLVGPFTTDEEAANWATCSLPSGLVWHSEPIAWPLLRPTTSTDAYRRGVEAARDAVLSLADQQSNLPD